MTTCCQSMKEAISDGDITQYEFDYSLRGETITHHDGEDSEGNVYHDVVTHRGMTIKFCPFCGVRLQEGEEEGEE